MVSAVETGESTTPAVRACVQFFTTLWQKYGDLVDRLIPAEFVADPEKLRHARLVTRFGWLGTIFGIIYGIAYFLIGHKAGAGIVLICSTCFVVAPFLLQRRKSVELAGNFLCLVLLLGFTALALIEGGLHGHAIAWLVSVPLCALLLVGVQSAILWVICSFASAGLLVTLDVAGIEVPTVYATQWRTSVSAAGYLGLILFMFFLGMIFESSRSRAFAKMQGALKDLASSNEQLTYLNKEKNEFLGMAAHDLKNPLTVIIGNAELLTLIKDPEKTAKITNTITLAAKRMRDLITNLLDANAIEQGKVISNVVPCEVQALLAQSMEHNRDAATKKQIRVHLGPATGLWARADGNAAVQILDNLLSNAIKYSPANTAVHIHVLPRGETVTVAVRDEGPGISEEDLKKMFKPYTRLTARPTAGESSNGLGLSIVKKLAEAMSGSIRCESQLGIGSAFIFALPACTAPESPVTKKDATPPDTASHSAIGAGTGCGGGD